MEPSPLRTALPVHAPDWPNMFLLLKLGVALGTVFFSFFPIALPLLEKALVAVWLSYKGRSSSHKFAKNFVEVSSNCSCNLLDWQSQPLNFVYDDFL